MAESRRYRRVTSIWSLLFPLVSILIVSTCTCHPSLHGFETPSLVERRSPPSSYQEEQDSSSSRHGMNSLSSGNFYRRIRNGRYCGPALNEILSLVCNGVYKRSSQMLPWKFNGNDERPHLERNRMEGKSLFPLFSLPDS